MKSTAAALTFLLWIAGCAAPPPAPVEDRSGSTSRGVPARGYYRVHRGDTLYAIAFEHGLDHRELARWNDLAPPYLIYPGQELRLAAPAGLARQRTRPRSPATVRTEPAPKPAPRGQPVEKPAARGTERSPPVEVNTPVLGASPPARWQWPAKGRVVRGFVPGDPARNGVDIAGREGTPVKAAAAGQVVYSGDGLIGYGELIIVKHNDQWLSAYAHNRKRLVAEGASVKQGQKLAELGRNDRDEEVLHFEIRSHGKPVDPLDYLPPR